MKRIFPVLIGMLLLISAAHFLLGTVSPGFGSEPVPGERLRFLFLSIRLPRLLTAAAAGTAMAVSGVLLQSFFRNPMADPFVLGIHSGASLGVALVTLLLRGFVGTVSGGGFWMVGSTAAAFAGAAAVTFLMSFLSVRMSTKATLLVTGLMIGYGLNAVISLLIFFSSPEEWEWYFAWNFASFSGTTLTESVVLMSVAVGSLVYAVRIGKNLNLYRLSADYAVSAGVDVRRLRFGLVAVSSVAAAFVSSFCGPVAFVGIAAPRFVMIFFRTDDSRILVPASALTGALLTVTADLSAKIPSLWMTALPLNPVLSFLGLPFVFAVLLGKGGEVTDD